MDIDDFNIASMTITLRNFSCCGNIAARAAFLTRLKSQSTAERVRLLFEEDAKLDAQILKYFANMKKGQLGPVPEESFLFALRCQIASEFWQTLDVSRRPFSLLKSATREDILTWSLVDYWQCVQRNALIVCAIDPDKALRKY